MNRLRKYADGRELRIAYAMTVTAFPDPSPRAEWHEISPFSAADVPSEPSLNTVFKTAIERGFAISPELGLKSKAK